MAVRTHLPNGPTRPKEIFVCAIQARPFAVVVLKPRVGPHHVEVAVAVQIGHAIGSDGAVNSGSDVMALPKLFRIGGNLEPAERLQRGAFVAHHHDVAPAIAVDVRRENIVCARGIGGEDEALERFARGLARVPIPHATAHEIRPAVAVHIERRDAHIGLIVRADNVLNPVRCATELEPVKSFRFHAAPAQHEIQIAIAVEVHQRGQAIVARAAFADGQIATDEMMLETEFGGRGRICEKDEPGGLRQQQQVTFHGCARMNCARRTEKLSLLEKTRCIVSPSSEIHFDGKEAESPGIDVSNTTNRAPSAPATKMIRPKLRNGETTPRRKDAEPPKKNKLRAAIWIDR